jgi:hypothetical protein
MAYGSDEDKIADRFKGQIERGHRGGDGSHVAPVILEAGVGIKGSCHLIRSVLFFPIDRLSSSTDKATPTGAALPVLLSGRRPAPAAPPLSGFRPDDDLSCWARRVGHTVGTPLSFERPPVALSQPARCVSRVQIIAASGALTL